MLTVNKCKKNKTFKCGCCEEEYDMSLRFAVVFVDEECFCCPDCLSNSFANEPEKILNVKRE